MSLYITGFLLCSLLFSSKQAFAQRCATVEYQKMRQKIHPHLEDKSTFEKWLNQKKESRKQNGTLRTQATIYAIPVVVHVIHTGEAEGRGVNISDEQILSQIEVLTEDFRRMNADASKTPPIFEPFAADLELEFVLAKQDPEGLATTGIVRVDGQQAEWDLTENYELKSLSYWPAEDYLNIWVTDLSGVYLGYAQFPESSQVQGLDDASNSRVTDGVVIDYAVFGSKEKYPPANLIADFSLGRTTTHEVGHFFGLRHIWGDDSGGCTASDYVDDTPNQGGSTTNCPAEDKISCNSTDMVQNYMDYTDDACMNLFTKGQKERVRIILDNSPRRASLKTSQGAQAPVIVSNDLGIRKVLNPSNFTCSGPVIPSLEIRNYGDNQITSAEIAIFVNGQIQQTAAFSLDLAPLDIANIAFEAINLTAPNTYTVAFEIQAVNNTVDEKSSNNAASERVVAPESVAVPFRETFNTVPLGGVPAQWTVLNPDENQTWEAVNADNGEASNTAMYVDFYNYELNGEYDTLLTPVFDLTDIPFAILSFARSYAMFPGVEDEGLIIKLSTNCGKTFDHTLFESYGSELATAPQTSSEFIPSGPEAWKRECLILDQFLGLSNLRVAFIARNGHGNNLYIDDIFIDSSDNASNLKDLAVVSITQPALVSCAQQQATKVLVKNQGCTIEDQFQLMYQFNNGPVFSDTIVTTPLNPGQGLEVVLNNAPLDVGVHTYSIALSGVNDKNPSNDQISGQLYINNDTDQIPVREDFENFSSSDWIVANATGSRGWETVFTSQSVALHLDPQNAVQGQEEWLVSPVLDFSSAQYAILSFELAYAYLVESKDALKILVSTNCGLTYDDVIFDRFSEELNTGDFVGQPNSEENWSEIRLNMMQYLGEEEVRIAFIATNAKGNDIYLDDIQTFVTTSSISGINKIYPNPSEDGLINITFDLPEKETVEVIMYNTYGQILSEMTLTNTLNQTYTLDFSNQSQGVYLFKVVGESFSYVKRVVLRH